MGEVTKMLITLPAVTPEVKLKCVPSNSNTLCAQQLKFLDFFLNVPYTNMISQYLIIIFVPCCFLHPNITGTVQVE